MNFKKYHVSRNLVRVANDNCVIYSNYNNFTINGDIIDTTGNALFGFKVKVESNATYCVSSQRDRLYMRIREYSSEPANWENDYIVQSVNDDTHDSVSFTTTSTTKWVLVAFYTTRTTTISNIMLNTGSQPLPYEPYSPEVWHDIPHYIHKTDTDTITTLPTVIYANDTTATVGLKGQMEQSSTPTPTTPIQPQECGERTGNLFDKNDIVINLYINSSGDIVYGSNGFVSNKIPVFENKNYCLQNLEQKFLNGYYVAFYDEQDNPLSVIDPRNQNSVIFTAAIGSKYFRYSGNRNITLTVTTFTEGSTAPESYVPYGYKIPILSANTTTPVYLGEVESTRNIRELVFDGTENVSYNARNDTIGRWAVTIPTANGTTTPENVICTHFKTVNSTSKPLSEGGICMRSTGVDVVVGGLYTDIGITAPSDSTPIVNAVKAYLAQQYAAGTPVTVWYVLATPTTGTVNEPLRKISDYADEVSNVSIPTTAGANTLSIGTTLQPSEVSVNYKGWHPVANVHERENGAWT